MPFTGKHGVGTDSNKHCICINYSFTICRCYVSLYCVPKQSYRSAHLAICRFWPRATEVDSADSTCTHELDSVDGSDSAAKGADSMRHGGHVPPTFTNGWVRGHRKQNIKQEIENTSYHGRLKHRYVAGNYLCLYHCC